jgi:nucleotide-binding universal stress UspA family protein
MIKFGSILCPVDFFPASEHAFDYAIALAQNYDADVHVLHVVSAVTPTSYEFQLNTAEVLTQLRKHAEEKMKSLVARAEEAGVSAHPETRIGDIDETIVHAVGEHKPDIVIMGTHGRRGFERWFLGSVTERLLRKSPVPVLTTSDAGSRARVPPDVRRVLVTTDFSEGTNRAMDYAFAIAQEAPAEVTLLHVMQQPPESREPLEGVRKILEDHLDSMVPPEVRNWCTVSARVEIGTPYQRVLAVAEETEVDLIVMNIHGIGLWERAVMGATAERVLRAAECPVLAIPPSADPTETA